MKNINLGNDVASINDEAQQYKKRLISEYVEQFRGKTIEIYRGNIGTNQSVLTKYNTITPFTLTIPNDAYLTLTSGMGCNYTDLVISTKKGKGGVRIATANGFRLID